VPFYLGIDILRMSILGNVKAVGESFFLLSRIRITPLRSLLRKKKQIERD